MCNELNFKGTQNTTGNTTLKKRLFKHRGLYIQITCLAQISVDTHPFD